MIVGNKRDFFKFSAGAIAGVGVAGCGGSEAAFGIKPAFVLIHGAWEGAWAYERLIPLLATHGHAAIARDLPGHGLNARFPASYGRRPLDPAAFGTEPSPVAGVTLETYVTSVIASIDELRALGFAKIILVGHSLSGVIASAVAERVPEKILKLVYLAGSMPRAGFPAAYYFSQPENQGELIAQQLMSDPNQTGALRVDFNSQDTSYRATSKLARYGDLSQLDYDAVANLLSCDEPVGPLGTPINTTAQRWGSLQRHYIRTSKDMAIRPALQARFIAEADAITPLNRTRVHTLNADHTPQLSQPAALADMLASIADIS